MATPTTGGPCENADPQVAAAKTTKRRRPLKSAPATSVQWCFTTRGLPVAAAPLASANYVPRAQERAAAAAPSPAGAAEQPTPAEAGRWVLQLTTAPPKRDHKALVIKKLPNLPAGFTMATDRIGALQATAGADGEPRRSERPVQDIVCEGPREDIFSGITHDTSNTKTRYRIIFTPSQKLRAAEYSLTQGYHSAEGVPPPRPAPARTTELCPNPARPALQVIPTIRR